MNGLKACLIFFAGAGTGAVIAWKILQKKYDNRLEDEVYSVKKVLGDKKPEKKKVHDEKTKDDIVTLVTDLGYTGSVVKEPTPVEDNDIFVITEDEFVDTEIAFEKITITHYADGYFTDDEGVITDGDSLIGAHTLDDVEPGFDGVMYVRNEYLSSDYEILFTTELYSECIKEE